VPDVYQRLIADLDAAGAGYRLIDHPPEGRIVAEGVPQ
jgi:Ala-tRNA(Pro) deacylase